MAQKTPDSPKKHRPKLSGCFPGCFRSSKSHKVKEQNPTKKPSSKKSSWLISWSRKSAKKTSPGVFVEEKIQKIRKESFRVAKLSKKFSSSNHDREFPVDSSAPPGRTPATAAGDEVVHRQPDKAREEKNHGEIFPENGSSLNPVIKEKKGILIFKRNSSLPAVDKNQRISPVLSHSASMPPSTSAGKQPAGAVIGGANQENVGALTGRFDQLVGMSIIVVTLLIMVIWGKVCAILCTSAWLYFYPNILRATKFDQPSKNTKSLDVPGSKKLKKKVVFEGLLE